LVGTAAIDLALLDAVPPAALAAAAATTTAAAIPYAQLCVPFATGRAVVATLGFAKYAAGASTSDKALKASLSLGSVCRVSIDCSV